MLDAPRLHLSKGFYWLMKFWICSLFVAILTSYNSHQQEILPLKTDTLILDLYHKFGTIKDFKPRGSILIKPRSEYRVAQANILDQVELSATDLKELEDSSKKGDFYYLKASVRRKGDEVPLATSQTLIKSCSIYLGNLADSITINLSPLNDFININLLTDDLECQSPAPLALPRKFNTTVIVHSGSVGPAPDTATYIKRLEEERQNKLREGKDDNRSFFAKYWIYIVPAVIILMVFSGPADQGAR